jgi:iron complex outermembrane receptor protein
VYRFLLLALIGWMCAPEPARAAQATSTVSGSVQDDSGAVIPGARITLRGVEERAAVTTASGEFEFRDLPLGSYEVSAAADGFQAVTRTVRLQAAGQQVVVSVTLPLARLDTIVTAARTGADDVQALPISITAVSARELTRLGTVTVDQMAALAPSLTFTQNTNFGQLSIRGVGTNAVYAGADPSSVMYLDGVYLARPAMAFVEFLDLERVEVLRGPQGTLYGRNAVGGALNLVTRPPSNTFEMSARATGGDFGALRAEARISGPLTRDRLMGSVAFVRRVQDGYVRDLEHPDRPMGGDDVVAGRAQVAAVLGPRASVLVAGDMSRQSGIPLTFSKVLAVKPGFEVDNPADLHEVRASMPVSSSLSQYGASARLTMTLTPATTLVTLTAFRGLDYEFLLDADITELDISDFAQDESQQQLSEEITISHRQSRVTWVGGAFLFAERDRQSLLSDQQPSQSQIRLLPQVDATSRAVFGQATVDLTPQLSATAGLRYTSERKEIDNAQGRFGLDAPYAPVPGTVSSYSDSIAHGAWTPRFVMEMKLPGGTLAYGSASRGFKSGGFNPSSTEAGRGFAPEWAWSYEAGLKGTWLDGRSRVAAAGFFMDYTNLQVQTPIQPGVYDIRNAAAATIRGVEIENSTRLGRGLHAGGHLTWLDATYDRYIAVAVGGATGDVAGRRLNNAPEWAGRLWLEWEGSVAGAGRLSVSADASGQSTVFYTPFNDDIQRQRPYGLLGSRVEYGPADRRWAIGAYARNLTNTDYITATFGTSQVAFGGRPGAPRQFAVDFTVRR